MRFNTLGNHYSDIEPFSHKQDARNDGLTCLVVADVAGQLHINLEHVRLKRRQQIEAGIAGAKVVYRRSKTLATVFVENANQMLRVIHSLTPSVTSNIRRSVGKSNSRLASSVARIQVSAR